MAGKLAVMGYLNRLKPHQKVVLNQLFDELLHMEKAIKNHERVDDLCDHIENTFTQFINDFRK